MTRKRNPAGLEDAGISQPGLEFVRCRNFEIGRILHLKFETRNLRMDSLACGVWAVHSEISSFEFEMQVECAPEMRQRN